MKTETQYNIDFAFVQFVGLFITFLDFGIKNIVLMIHQFYFHEKRIETNKDFSLEFLIEL